MKLSFTMLMEILWTGLVAASDIPTVTNITPTGPGRDGDRALWPVTAHVSTRSPNQETNAWRIQRGLPLQQPKKLYHYNNRRAVAAPSYGVSGPSTYVFVGCNTGGDSFVASTAVSGDLQQMVDQCAAFQAAQTGISTVFALYPGGKRCYAGVTYPAKRPVDCSDGSAIIADYRSV